MSTPPCRYGERPASSRGRRARAAGAALALTAAFVGSAGLAAQAPAHGAPRVHLVARDEPVRDVFLRLGEQAHLNVSLADDVRGTVSLTVSDATPEEALHALCAQARLRCARDGRTVLVSGRGSAVVPLAVVPAGRAAHMLRGLFPHLSVRESGAGNTLVLAGSEADIQAARVVVAGLDVRDPRAPTTEAVGLRSQSASVVAERLRALYPGAKITVVSKSGMLVSAPPADLTQIKAALAGIDAAAPVPTVAPQASDAVTIVQRRPADVARGISSQLPHLRVGVSGPAVTLTGAPEDVTRARALIAQLDVPPYGSRFTQIYRVKNVDAQSVADLVRRAFPQAAVSVDAGLNAISVTAVAVDQQRIAAGIAQLDGTSSGGGAGRDEGAAQVAQSGTHTIVQLRSIVPGVQGSGTSAQDIAIAVQTALQQSYPDLRVTVPNGMQALILTGSAPAVRDAKDLIATLDVVPQSVVLDTEILELDENSSRNLGLQLGTTSIGTTFSEVQPTPGPSGQSGRLIGFQALTRTPIAFQAQVNLLLQNGRARVLADPRITTLSGRTATIRAGDTISILTTIGGGTGTVATTQLESFQTGVTLDITPIITDAGEMSVALHPIVNSLTGYLNGVPQISTRDTQTTVHLRDNETLVIGGLIQENTQRTESKVPLVGDIPLLGRVFRNTNTTSTRNELIIVVTPHVLGIAGTTVPNAALPPGMSVPTPRPLPTLAPDVRFPIVAPPTPAPLPTAAPAAAPGNPSAKAAGQPSAGPSGSPAPALPSAFAQANTFVFGSPPVNTYAGPGDPPQIFYVTLTPTAFTPSSTVRISAITTTNVQRLTIASGTSSISLSPVSPGTWQGLFSANVLGLPSSSSLRLLLTGARRDGQSASIPITVAVPHGSSGGDNTQL
jgi:type II secretory pathway component GspD/PulD (secretin)